MIDVHPVTDDAKTIKLFAYFATADDGGLKRLRNSIALQSRFRVFDIRSRKVLTIGGPDYEPTDDIRDYFDEIITIDAYHLDDDGNRRLNYCRLRNVCLDYALNVDAKWLYFCDIDTVFVKLAEPDEGNLFNIARVYWQRNAEETLDWSVDHIANWGEAVFSAGNSWFIIHHSLFRRFRFNEHLWGYTFDDTEYAIRVFSAVGGPHKVMGAHVVHVFHDNALRNLEYVSYNRNQSIYNAVHNMTQHDRNLTGSLFYYDPRVNDAIVIDEREKLVFSSHCEGAGVFLASDDKLFLVKWRDRGALYRIVSEKPFEHTISRLALFSLATEPMTIQAGPQEDNSNLHVDFNNNVIHHGDRSEPSNFVFDGSALDVRRKDGAVATYRITRVDLEKI